MRIISKFRDYYDSVQAHGFDERLVYMRETRELIIAPNVWNYPVFLEMLSEMPGDLRFEVEGHIIAFCGVSYPVWKCDAEWCWNGNDIALYLDKRGKRSDLQSFERPDVGYMLDNPQRARYSGPWSSKYPLSLKGVTRFVADFDSKPIGEEIHIEYGSPVLLVHYVKDWAYAKFTVTIDPCLKSLGFVTKVDAFTAFQEIAMYLGNQLAQPDIAPQSVGDDETLARAKGFDEKSFRTQAPGSKKLNRKANRARKKKSQ